MIADLVTLMVSLALTLIGFLLGLWWNSRRDWTDSVDIRFRKDNGVFVGYCPTFQVYSQGDTFEKALKAMSEAIGLKLVSRALMGQRNADL
jgi:predicted RNase H-like HicB family nuclease